MKYAKLTKPGGELIEASQADYSDYKGFLRCPECGEPVFLRKAHQRHEITVADAFVHHKAIPEVSVCEARVGRYTAEDVAKSHTKAKGQRLRTLQISLWKFLKGNLALGLKDWSKLVSDAKKYKLCAQVVQYGLEVIAANDGFILEDTLPRMAELFQSEDRQRLIVTTPDKAKATNQFLTSRARDWRLHTQITHEALELFLSSPSMREIRYRLCCCLCHPNTLAPMPELLDLDMATEEWRSKFVSFVTLQVAMIFLTVDWVGIWEKNK